MRPDERLHPKIVLDIRRYFSYGWGNAIIMDLVLFRYGVNLRARCLEHLRRGDECSSRCANRCAFDE